MPEVKMIFSYFGSIAGTIGFGRIDGKAIAHIALQNKEIGKKNVFLGLERRYQHERSYEPLTKRML
jgi:hypothetical protein